ncbi:hypothetical protein [Nostoc sp.]
MTSITEIALNIYRISTYDQNNRYAIHPVSSEGRRIIIVLCCVKF